MKTPESDVASDVSPQASNRAFALTTSGIALGLVVAFVFGHSMRHPVGAKPFTACVTLEKQGDLDGAIRECSSVIRAAGEDSHMGHLAAAKLDELKSRKHPVAARAK
jgi:hypothetical protein